VVTSKLTKDLVPTGLEKRREGGSVLGQLLGTGGGAGMSTCGGVCAWQKGQSKREEKRGQQDFKRWPRFLPLVPSNRKQPKRGHCSIVGRPAREKGGGVVKEVIRWCSNRF
jgi:hypothetical protein